MRKTSKNSANKRLNSVSEASPKISLKNSQTSPFKNQHKKSPLSSSKHQSTVKTNVSYGELQIILQNIHHIKQKAGNQVQQLINQNANLKIQIDQIKKQLLEKRSMNDGFAEQKQRIESDYKAQLKQIKQRQLNLQNEILQWQQKYSANEEKIQKLLKDLNKVKQNLIKQQQERAMIENREYNLINILTGKQPQKLQQIEWKIKDESPSGLLPVFKQFASIKQEIKLKQQQISMLEDQIFQMRLNVSNSNSMLEKCLNDFQTSNNKVLNYEDQIKQQIDKFYRLEQRYQMTIRQMQQQLNKKDNQLGQMKKKSQSSITEKERQLEQQKSIIALLTSKINERQKEDLRIKNKHNYENLVDSVCDQTSDYAQLVNKIQYLENFRNQHYFNVEKIEFLCKMLDQ